MNDGFSKLNCQFNFDWAGRAVFIVLITPAVEVVHEILTMYQEETDPEGFWTPKRIEVLDHDSHYFRVPASYSGINRRSPALRPHQGT